MRYSSLKNLALRLALRFLDHNPRTRFFQNMLFLRKVKENWHFCVKAKNDIYPCGKDFSKTLKASFLGFFWALWAPLNFNSKTRICHFFYFPMPKTSWKKKSRVSVQLVFTWRRRMDVQLLYSGTFLWDFCWKYFIIRPHTSRNCSQYKIINLEDGNKIKLELTEMPTFKNQMRVKCELSEPNSQLL